METLSTVDLIMILESVEDRLDMLRDQGYLGASDEWVDAKLEGEYEALESAYKKLSKHYNEVMGYV